MGNRSKIKNIKNSQLTDKTKQELEIDFSFLLSKTYYYSKSKLKNKPTFEIV